MRAFLTVLFHFLPLSAAFLFASAHAADDGRFDLFEIRVEGNTVLPALLIERAVYPSLGEKKGIQDVEAARAALEKLYQDNGYLTVLVDIPEQEVKNGVVRLRVTEGRVERLRVTGSRYFSLGRIREKTPDLAEGSVPYFPDVQKQLAAVNRGGDRRVTPVLRPGRSPGKVEVDLKVDDRLPLHGSVELNDRYSANTTRTRLNANMRYDNLWQREHSLSLGVQTAPQEPAESTVFSATYVWPTDKGNYLAAYGVISESDVAALGDVANCLKNAQAHTDHKIKADNGKWYVTRFGNSVDPFKAIAVLSADSYGKENGWTYRNIYGAGSFAPATQTASAGATGIAPSKANLLTGAWELAVELTMQYRNANVTNVQGDTISALTGVKKAFADELIKRSGDPAKIDLNAKKQVYAALPDYYDPTAGGVFTAHTALGSHQGNMCKPMVRKY
ncbi:MAG: hypothetical protein M1449_02095 [Candidatus Thermoplasmatota archaeon]|nr:hypothetical protein [Candidatus Thermoplasmatota archaeon]